MSLINNAHPVVIGLDHGFGNVKTAHTCIKAGVTAHDNEPTFKNELLVYDGRYYTIGDEHKEFVTDKAGDQDYYILTLAAVARELRFRGLSSARVFLAAGLPLTWVSGQRDSFKAYLLQKPAVDFTYRGAAYHVEFAGAEIYPQGFSAVADRLHEFRGVNMLCDIGNGTMNVMYIRNGKPDATRCFTEKYGVQQCMIVVRERLMQKFGAVVDDGVIEDVLRFGKADIGERYLTVIHECAKEYTGGILKRLRDHEYNPDLMRLYVMGGGSCLMLLHDVNYPRVTHANSLMKNVRDYKPSEKVDFILMNPPYGGHEQDGIQVNFPSKLRSSETANLFMIEILYRLNDSGRCGVILPDGFLQNDDASLIAIKEKLFKECNVHTIIRMPGSCFAPYTPIATNLLFFDKTGSTTETWFYRFDLPGNQKFSMKRNPITREKLSAIDEWWDNRREIMDEKSDNSLTETWKSLCVSIDTIINGGYNLDFCGFPNAEKVILSPEETIVRFKEERDRLDHKLDEKLQVILDMLECTK